MVKKVLDRIKGWADAFYEACATLGVMFALLVGITLVSGGSFVVETGAGQSELELAQWVGVVLLVVGFAGLASLCIRMVTGIWGEMKKRVGQKYRLGKYLWEE